MGSACFAKGNQENLEYIKEFIEENGLDAKIKIIGSLCENKCSVGPRIYIDDVEHIQVSRTELINLLEDLK
jgi:NADH:ubiquinone oxidoreductase subunit E